MNSHSIRVSYILHTCSVYIQSILFIYLLLWISSQYIAQESEKKWVRALLASLILLLRKSIMNWETWAWHLAFWSSAVWFGNMQRPPGDGGSVLLPFRTIAAGKVLFFFFLAPAIKKKKKRETSFWSGPFWLSSFLREKLLQFVNISVCERRLWTDSVLELWFCCFVAQQLAFFSFFLELKFTFLDDMDFGLNFDTGHRVQHERAHTVFPTTSTQSFSAERVDCFQVSLRITFWITPFDSKRPCHYKAAFSNEYDSTLCLRSPTSLHFCFAAVSFIVIISSTQPLLCTILFCVCGFFFCGHVELYQSVEPDSIGWWCGR